MHWRTTERIDSCKYLLSHRCMTNRGTCMNRYQILAIFSHKLMNFITLSSQFPILLLKSGNSCPEKWYSFTTVHSHCNPCKDFLFRIKFTEGNPWMKEVISQRTCSWHNCHECIQTKVSRFCQYRCNSSFSYTQIELK